jgi:hypothetical protein
MASLASGAPLRPGFIVTRNGTTLEGGIQLTDGGFNVLSTNTAGATNTVPVPLTNLARLRFDVAVREPSATGRGKGTGLLGYYFANTTATGNVVVRLDQTIDFDWGTAEPVHGVPKDFFSVIWMGDVEAPASRPFTFYIGTDDGGRLFVNERLLCESWQRQELAEANGTVVLQAGQRARLRFEYFDFFGNSRARLLWSGPDTPKSVIPKERLHAASYLTNHTAFITGERGLLGTFYRNSDFTGPTYSRLEPTIDLSGDEGALAPSFSPNSCSVRWRGQVLPPASELYAFHLVSDEPARLWIDGQLLIDRAEGQLGEAEERVPLKAGERYDLEVEAQNTRGGLVARLLWSSPSLPKSVIPAARLVPSRLTPAKDTGIEGSITLPAGLVLRNGTFLAGAVTAASGTSVRVSGFLQGQPISTVNVARIFCRGISQNQLGRVPSGRIGALLAKGDFIDGEFRGLSERRLQLSSILFGPRSYDAQNEVLAVFLREVTPAPNSFEIQLRDRSELRVENVAVNPEGLAIQDKLLGSLAVPVENMVGLEGR